MAKRWHISNRNGVFYWRRRLPQRIARAFGRSHVLLSMRLRDRKAAGRLAPMLSANLDHFIHVMQVKIELLAEGAVAIDNERLVGRIAFRQIAIQHRKA